MLHKMIISSKNKWAYHLYLIHKRNLGKIEFPRDLLDHLNGTKIPISTSVSFHLFSPLVIVQKAFSSYYLPGIAFSFSLAAAEYDPPSLLPASLFVFVSLSLNHCLVQSIEKRILTHKEGVMSAYLVLLSTHTHQAYWPQLSTRCEILQQ